MSSKLFALLLMGVLGVSLLWAVPEKGFHLQKASHSLPVRGGANDAQLNVDVAPWRPSRQHFDEYVGIIDTAGTTWYDYQHNGTCGKMIAVDALGMVSVVWMNGLYPDPAQTRQVFYNVWDPTTADFIFDTVGIRIDAAPRAGYVCQVTDANGFCYPAFHQVAGNGNPHAAAAGDYAAYSDAFTSWEPDWCYDGTQDLQLIWPKIARDINGVLHMVSTESPLSGMASDPQRIYYSRGIPEFDEYGFFLDILWDDMDCGGYQIFDTVMVIAPDVACSRHSSRVAIAWPHSMDDLNSARRSQYANEIYLRVSEDGGLNWDAPINVTQWIQWDSECYHGGGDPLDCDGDTLRAYTDVSILFDEEDHIHIAFTTIGFWWYLPGETDSGWVSLERALIWHWNEETRYLSLVADGWYPAYQPGVYQRNVQRPSLAIDPTTSYLYCSYQKFDTATYSENGYPMADAFVTVSTNNGVQWGVGIDVTNTTPSMVPVPTGESMHERDVTLADLLTNGYIHMEYILDKDAGSVPQSEGVATLNPVIYQRIPANDIATLPLTSSYPFHVCRLHLVSPEGGEQWHVFQPDTIRWTSGNLGFGLVHVELNRTYPSGEWEVLLDSTENDGEESVFITGQPSYHCRIRIRAIPDSCWDVSTADFSIRGPCYGGNVSGVWGVEYSTIYICDYATVCSDDTLEIEPGVAVEFWDHYEFDIRGTLLAIGTEQNPIIFTADTVANPNRWGGLRFHGSGSSGSQIAFCVIENSVQEGYGGGVYFENASPDFANCAIRGNRSLHDGGGAYCYQSSPSFTNCVISENRAAFSGGGVFSAYGSANFINCTISGNASRYGGGIACWYDNSLTVTNTIIWDNCADNAGDELYLFGSGARITFECSNVDSSGIAGQGNITWVDPNILGDPLFCEPENCASAPTTNGDYHIWENSPCAPAAQPECGLIGALAVGCFIFPEIVPNLTILPLGLDIALRWSQATDSFGHPTPPDFYLVFYGETSEGPFFFRGATSDTCYTIYEEIATAEKIFYQVEAYVGLMGLIQAALAELGEHPRHEELWRFLRSYSRVTR